MGEVVTAGPYLNANGARVTAVDVAIPYYGLPVADVALATTTPLTSPVTLRLGNLTLRMAVMRDPATGVPRQRAFAGSTQARLVGGAGAWPTKVTLSPYDSPAGVLLSAVLRDAAKATGASDATREQVQLGAGLDRSLGVRYVPQTGAPAGRILALLAGALWWIDVAGITQINATRPSSAITSATTAEHYDGGRQLLTVATEDPASWMPGASFVGPTVPAGVTVVASRISSGNDGLLRVEALVA